MLVHVTFDVKLSSFQDRGSVSEDVPAEAEMSLIYQSLAWILAALLMSIVIFFMVAFLINKKKNCIQMSCYNAPKKVSM